MEEIISVLVWDDILFENSIHVEIVLSVMISHDSEILFLPLLMGFVNHFVSNAILKCAEDCQISMM